MSFVFCQWKGLLCKKGPISSLLSGRWLEERPKPDSFHQSKVHWGNRDSQRQRKILPRNKRLLNFFAKKTGKLALWKWEHFRVTHVARKKNIMWFKDKFHKLSWEKFNLRLWKVFFSRQVYLVHILFHGLFWTRCKCFYGLAAKSFRFGVRKKAGKSFAITFLFFPGEFCLFSPVKEGLERTKASSEVVGKGTESKQNQVYKTFSGLSQFVTKHLQNFVPNICPWNWPFWRMLIFSNSRHKGFNRDFQCLEMF